MQEGIPLRLLLPFLAILVLLVSGCPDPADDDTQPLDDDVGDDDTTSSDDDDDDDTTPSDDDDDDTSPSDDDDDTTPSDDDDDDDTTPTDDDDSAAADDDDSAGPVDADGDGYPEDLDCDDTDATVNPGAAEVACDWVDNDCDGVLHADETDDDGDGTTECDLDCDDTDPTAFHNAPELCDGADNDCDGVVPADETDGDGDGQRICDGDCDDADSATWTGAPEICDGLDNNCNGVVPADETDDDGDGHDECGDGDCDDSEAAVYVDAPEICDGLDDNCNGVIPLDEVDGDGDGFMPCEGDCDDGDADAFPGHVEDCFDGVDNDCDGAVDGLDDACVGGDDDDSFADDDDSQGDDDDDSLGDDDDDSLGDDDDDSLGDDDDSAAAEADCLGMAGYYYAANGHCYVPHWGQGSWEDAYAACMGDGGYLVTLDDAAEEAFLWTFYPDRYWMGFSDYCGDWEWITGEPMTYIHWGAGEPNDFGGPEQCGESYAGGPWNDLWCDDPGHYNEGYVCEFGIDGDFCFRATEADARFLGDAAEDQAGRYVAHAGDLDGDGFGDVVVGAKYHDGNGSGSGALYVIYGPVAGDVELTAADAVLLGEAAGDVAAVPSPVSGDLTGDGLADLLVGAPGADSGGLDSGAVYLVHGPVYGEVQLSSAAAELVGEDAGDRAGCAVSQAGDVDGDGDTDILVGALYHDGNGTDSGGAYLVHGPVSGTLNLANADACMMGDAAYDKAGRSVCAAGDVNADGFADLLVGAPGNNDGGTNAGAAYLIAGPASGSFDLSLAIQLTGEEADDEAGYSVAGAGDLDGDGYADLLVGAPGRGADENGSVYVVHGPVTAAMDLSAAAAEFSGDAGDGAGWAVAAAGDVTGDGLGDVLVGAPDGACGYPCETGMVYLIAGPFAGSLGVADAALKFAGPENGFAAGTSVGGGGDVDGDGRIDLLVGAPETGTGGPGEAYLLLGDEAWGEVQPGDDDDVADDDDDLGDDDDDLGDDDDDLGDDDDDLGDDDDSLGDDDDSLGDDDDSLGDDDDSLGDDDDSLPAGDLDGDGWTVDQGDCDDLDPAVNPAAAELCNGTDDDCDGSVDEECTTCDLTVPGDHATIQDAVLAAVGSEVICIEPGTYLETVQLLGKAVHLLGIGGAAATVLDGQRQGSVVVMNNGESATTVLQGLTITGGDAALDGGGIRLVGASPTLTQLVVTDNWAWRGAGICASDYSSPALTDVVISYNTSSHDGGGMMAMLDSSPTLERVLITGNWATEGNAGFVAWYDSHATLSHVVSTYNQSANGGMDGLAFITDSNGVVSNAVVAGNSSANGGGVGITVSSSWVTMDNILVAGNTAGIWDGGGMSVCTGGITLSNAMIIGNHADRRGGAMMLTSADGTMDHVTIAGNTAGDSGGGMTFSGESTTIELTHVVIAANEVGDYGGGLDVAHGPGPARMAYSSVFGNFPDDFWGMADPTGLDGNVAEDPLHLETSAPDPLDWDLHLGAASSLIDAGDPATTDPDGSPADMGAYGGPGAASWDLDRDGYPEWWQPGEYDVATYPGQGWDCDDLDPAAFAGAVEDCYDGLDNDCDGFVDQLDPDC